MRLKCPWLFSCLVLILLGCGCASRQTAGASAPSPITESTGAHLFILSGQSNMEGLDPAETLTPMVEAAFGRDHVIVVKDAESGRSIRRWYKGWHVPNPRRETPIGDLYDRLMTKVQAAIEGRQIETVTFIWMQGERDARDRNGDVYAESLEGVIDQLRHDLKRDDIFVVIGRLSDFDLNNQHYPHWTVVREAQVALADRHPRYAWVNTDDLNDGINRQGNEIHNDLHYSKRGYTILGERFAEKAIELIHKTRGDVVSE